MRRKKSKEEKRAIRRIFGSVRILVFFAALFVLAVIGLILPLRPTESLIENRTLEEFPAFTFSSLWNGDYFGDISTWYADTFPFRESMLSANSKFENLFGIKGEQIVFSDAQAVEEVTADNTMGDAMTTGETVDETTSEMESQGELADAAELYGEDYVDAAIDVEPESVGTVYLTGNSAFELFWDNYPAADQFISVLNKAEAKLGDVANLYVMVPPNAAGIELTDKVQQKLGAGDQKAFTDYIYDGVDSSIQTVQVYDYLKSHDDEYIYFRTDHHWTALGAYYAYTAFCDIKGITPTPLEEYETVEFPGFLGTLYSGSNQAASLANDPDTVVAYIPKATNNMIFWQNGTEMLNWYVVYDVSEYRNGEKYSCFIAGDQPFAEIDNPTLNDGSSCVVVKDSYANAFIPFLIDQYEHIYVVDFRYFYEYPDYGNSVYNLVVDKDVDDVLILINIQDVVQSQVEEISALFN